MCFSQFNSMFHSIKGNMQIIDSKQLPVITAQQSTKESFNERFIAASCFLRLQAA